MIKKENQVGSKTDKTNVKAPYRSPHLETYGDIRELTRTAKGANPDTTPDKADNKTG